MAVPQPIYQAGNDYALEVLELIGLRQDRNKLEYVFIIFFFIFAKNR